MCFGTASNWDENDAAAGAAGALAGAGTEGPLEAEEVEVPPAGSSPSNSIGAGATAAAGGAARAGATVGKLVEAAVSAVSEILAITISTTDCEVALPAVKAALTMAWSETSVRACCMRPAWW